MVVKLTLSKLEISSILYPMERTLAEAMMEQWYMENTNQVVQLVLLWELHQARVPILGNLEATSTKVLVFVETLEMNRFTVANSRK